MDLVRLVRRAAAAILLVIAARSSRIAPAGRGESFRS
jgi:hypothetical protein